MRTTFLSGLFFVVFAATMVVVNIGTHAQAPTITSGITVVELFTTQGCSSCPPADKIFENVAHSARDDAGLIALACHVTYFDRKSWKDHLSIPLCDYRHKSYFKALDLPQLFTPQMIVNGEFDLVGNKEQIVYDAIAMGKSLKTIAPIKLSLQPSYLDITLPRLGLGAPVDVWLIPYNRQSQAVISGGGNRGEVINYMNYVKDFKKLLTWDGRPVNMAFPINNMPADGYAVVAQFKDHTNIIAAGKVEAVQ